MVGGEMGAGEDDRVEWAQVHRRNSVECLCCLWVRKLVPEHGDGPGSDLLRAECDVEERTVAPNEKDVHGVSPGNSLSDFWKTRNPRRYNRPIRSWAGSTRGLFVRGDWLALVVRVRKAARSCLVVADACIADVDCSVARSNVGPVAPPGLVCSPQAVELISSSLGDRGPDSHDFRLGLSLFLVCVHRHAAGVRCWSAGGVAGGLHDATRRYGPVTRWLQGDDDRRLRLLERWRNAELAQAEDDNGEYTDSGVDEGLNEWRECWQEASGRSDGVART